MNLIDASLRRPVTVILCTVALVLFGLLSLQTMGMQRLPDVDFPLVAVFTTMDGANATVIDHDVTDVIEEQLTGISGVENMNSYSFEGQGITMIEFGLGRDVDAAAADVRDKVNLARSDLPDEAEAPIVYKFSMADDAVVVVAVLGDAPLVEKVTFVDKIAKGRLQSVDGVGNVGTPGLRKREIRIWLDPTKLEARNLTVSDISAAIRNKHVELPAGSVRTGTHKYELRMGGEYASVGELQTLPVAVRPGGIVRLGDVSRVEDGFEERTGAATYNGEDVIFLSIGKRRGANEVSVANGVLENLESLRNEAPAGVRLEVISNKADFVRRSMKGVLDDTWMAVALTALIMLFFLQTFRATFVTVVTIPACLLGSFLLMRSMGININNLSMMGISLSVGMVVDATSVVLENVHRHMEDGAPALEATAFGAKEVAFSVLGGGLTTIAVFAPVAFMGGIVGRFFYSFGVTIVCTIGLSIVLSLTLTPFLCSRMLRRDSPGRIARFVESFLTALEGGYRLLLAQAVRFRWVTLVVAFGLFAFGLFFASKLGSSLYPKEDQGEVTINYELPEGTSLEASEGFLARIGSEVRAHEEVKYVYGSIGSDMGQAANKGSLNVSLIPRSRRRSQKQIEADLRKELSHFHDARFSFVTNGEKDITMALLGGDTKELVRLSAPIIAELRRQKGLIDVDTDVRIEKPQLDIRLNRARTDDIDLNVRDLSQEIRTYFGGAKAGVFKEGGFRYDIRLMAEGALRRDVADVERIAVRNGAGELVRVPGLISVEKTFAPSVIRRYDRRASLEISANVLDISVGEGMALIESVAEKHLPKDGAITLRPSGESKNMGKDFERLLQALVIAIALVYLVMAIQFESFLHPFTVMFSLPLLTPGAFGLLLLSGQELNIMSYIGIILLVGIVVNNGIILVDFIIQERARGIEKTVAVIKAGPLRLRAILITALSTMIGSLPVALGISEGAELRQPMAIAVVGGLFTSTMLTLFVIPVVYLILDDAKDAMARAYGWIRGTKAAPAAPGVTGGK